jgi:hypothetical protein
MELREAGHTQLLANFARFFKAKRDQGSYEVRSFCSSLLAGLYLPSYQQVEAAIQDFWEQRVEDATFTQAEVRASRCTPAARSPILALRWLPC